MTGTSDLIREQFEDLAKEATDDVCTYCGALDNGTCAYPSEGKSGCVRDARLSREVSGD